MINQITDLPFHLKDYATAKNYHDRIKPISGRGRNAGLRPICDTKNGRKKTQYLIREREWGAQAPAAIECVLYETPVVTFVEDGTIILDNTYSSFTTNAFMQEILSPYRAQVSEKGGQTWIGLGDLHAYRKHWWLPYGDRVVFAPDGNSLRPIEPRLINRWEVNRAAAREVYARFENFVSHCLAISKVIDPESFYKNNMEKYWSNANKVFCFGSIPEPFDPENITDYWAKATTSVIFHAIDQTRDWGNNGFTTRFSLESKKIRKNVHDSLKREFSNEIFTPIKAEEGVFSMAINVEYIR